ncbi:MAG: dihydroneopterin triphosphate diphosphatase [Betaproteobacteria bacterium]|nr:dihydroneopterin triphosphate diphosphatase [Betaproteobacteria bacterium]MDE2212332.1 dihydroneopterin triphosphate diphosphatase [Betaproteobacteria bacterium]
MTYKIPVSVLVVIYTPALDVLLLERADSPGFWQSVTGSCDAPDEPLAHTARREVREETGLDSETYRLTDWHQVNEFEIYERWRFRYAPGTTRNQEHVFGLEVPALVPVKVSPREHRGHLWLPWQEAAEKCFSWSNRQAILALPDRTA